MSGQGAGVPCYLHFQPEVLPAGKELVQRALSMLHVAAVLSIDQEPGEGTATCTWCHTRGHRSSKTPAAARSLYATQACEHMCTHACLRYLQLQCPDSLPGRLESLRVSHGSALSAPFYFLLILCMTRLGEGVSQNISKGHLLQAYFES